MHRFALTALAVSSLVLACQPTVGPMSDADVAAVRALGTSYAQAVLAGNAEAVAALYADDAVEMPPNVAARLGKATIQAAYEGGGGTTAFTLTSQRIDGRADLAYDRGTWSWTGVLPGQSEPSSDTGKYLAIARRQADGPWRWTEVIWNSDMPPAGVQQ